MYSPCFGLGSCLGTGCSRRLGTWCYRSIAPTDPVLRLRVLWAPRSRPVPFVARLGYLASSSPRASASSVSLSSAPSGPSASAPGALASSGGPLLMLWPRELLAPWSRPIPCVARLGSLALSALVLRHQTLHVHWPWCSYCFGTGYSRTTTDFGNCYGKKPHIHAVIAKTPRSCGEIKTASIRRRMKIIISQICRAESTKMII
ncbi:hypothetical protein LIER_37469 [Lithospermum erythrorhizon]|uniref:Uncharacterized protein n=1 Tax=Lithospermum erythrorhizon TaxID=34254 RepID=A0AAV3PM39_LITER